jgi:hypothetical protein
MFTVDRLLDAREAHLVRLKLWRVAPVESVKINMRYINILAAEKETYSMPTTKLTPHSCHDDSEYPLE